MYLYMHFLCLFYLSKLNFKNTEKSRENKIFFKFEEILPFLAKAIYGIYVSINKHDIYVSHFCSYKS